MFRPRKSSGWLIVAKSFGPIFGTALPKVLSPSSGYLPRNTGSIHQLLAHVLAWQLHMCSCAARRLASLSVAGMLVPPDGRDADLERLPGRRAKRLSRLAVREQGVVGGDEDLGARELVARRVDAALVTEQGEALRLVVRHPALHAIGVAASDEVRVLGEPGRAVRAQPTAAAVEGERVVPMKERHVGLDARGEERVDEAVVEGEALLVPGCRCLRGGCAARRGSGDKP